MRNAIVRIAKGVVPQRQWVHLQSVRSRNLQMRWLKESGVLELARRYSAVNGGAVLHGPFAGMQYPAESILSRHSVPRLVGSYECELHEPIQAALAARYDRVIDIGSAEGYYAVGFALKSSSPVTVFEADPRELELCKQMAALNQMRDRITPRTWCDPEALRSLTNGARCFVLSDCEGYETELFDEPTVGALRRSDVLIEIHNDAYEPLVARFSQTHDLRTFTARPRSAQGYPELACLGEQAELALCEFRPAGQPWLLAAARSAS